MSPARLLATSKQEAPVSHTLCIPHVPGDVAARRADNAELLQALPSAAIDSSEILEALRQSRAEH